MVIKVNSYKNRLVIQEDLLGHLPQEISIHLQTVLFHHPTQQQQQTQVLQDITGLIKVLVIVMSVLKLQTTIIYGRT